MPVKKQTVEMTIEEEIAKIEKEAKDKIFKLRNSLSWNSRFVTAFSDFLKHCTGELTKSLNGYKPDHDIENSINEYLRYVNLSVSFKASTFHNDLVDQNGISHMIDSYNISEYPVYTVFSVHEGSDLKGYIQINCNYSSYDGNQYSNWSFVKSNQITCTIFSKYQP